MNSSKNKSAEMIFKILLSSKSLKKEAEVLFEEYKTDLNQQTLIKLGQIAKKLTDEEAVVILDGFEKEGTDEINQILANLTDKNNTLIIGNGDIESLQEAKRMVKEYGVDGVMIGRGIFKNPYLFDQDHTGVKDTKQSLELLLLHLQLWEQEWGVSKNYNVLKKYFKIYISGFDGASVIRQKLMETSNPKEAEDIIKGYLSLQN
jgi:tRNA-dihydrouridine synthase